MKRHNKRTFKKTAVAQTLAAGGSAYQKEIQNRFLPFVKKAIATTRQDIASWKRAQALAQSDDPRNWQLQLLYEEVKNDALLTSQINNRVQQSLSMPFGLYKTNGEIDKDQTKILKKHPIYRFLNRAVLDSTYDGASLIELGFKPDLNGKLILEGSTVPRTNFVASTGLFYPDYFEDKSIKYRELAEFGTFILEFDSKTLGLVNKAVSHVLFKRFAQSCWAELCEIYGIPPRVMKTNTRDKNQLARAEQMMSDMGSASWFIIDDSESFEFAKGVATNGEVYYGLINLCGNEISMLISGAVIGQDTKNGNRSKEEASQEVLWYLVQDDMAALEQAWNNTIIPALVKHGVLKGDLTFEFDEAEDVSQLWKMTSESMPYYDIDPEFIKDKFGIPVIAKKDDTTEKKMLQLFLSAPAGTTGATMKTMAKKCCADHHTLSIGTNDFDTDAYLKRVWDAGGSLSFDTGLFLNTAGILSRGLKKGMHAASTASLSIDIGFSYGTDDPALLTAFESNIFRFAGSKTLAEAQELNEIFKKSKSFEDFYREASKVTKIHNKEWLETEYQTAVLTGEAASTFYRLKGVSETFPYWQYKTVGDSKVRADHRLLEGIILPFNDPLWDIIFPPNGWNCRCYIIPLMKDEVAGVDFKEMRKRVSEYLLSDDFKNVQAQGWGVNRAEIGQVFTANQMYVRKFAGKAAKIIEDIGAPDYGLKSYSNLKKAAAEDLPKYSGAAGDFLSQLEKIDDKPIIRDYNNRPISVPAKEFKAHTTGKRAFRVEYLEAMKQALQHPDEVWINNYKGTEFEDMISVKYFKDQTQIVVTRINNGKVSTLSTWFPLAERKDVISRYRRGLLVYSK